MSTVSQSTYFMWVSLPLQLCGKLSNIVSQRVVVSLLSGECVSSKTASVNLGPISRWSLTAVGTIFVSLLLHTGPACSSGRGRQSVLSQTVLTVGESLRPLPSVRSLRTGAASL